VIIVDSSASAVREFPFQRLDIIEHGDAIKKGIGFSLGKSPKKNHKTTSRDCRGPQYSNSFLLWYAARPMGSNLSRDWSNYGKSRSRDIEQTKGTFSHEMRSGAPCPDTFFVHRRNASECAIRCKPSTYCGATEP
jgi:hypothetical protein